MYLGERLCEYDHLPLLMLICCSHNLLLHNVSILRIWKSWLYFSRFSGARNYFKQTPLLSAVRDSISALPYVISNFILIPFNMSKRKKKGKRLSRQTPGIL